MSDWKENIREMTMYAFNYWGEDGPPPGKVDDPFVCRRDVLLIKDGRREHSYVSEIVENRTDVERGRDAAAAILQSHFENIGFCVDDVVCGLEEPQTEQAFGIDTFWPWRDV